MRRSGEASSFAGMYKKRSLHSIKHLRRETSSFHGNSRRETLSRAAWWIQPGLWPMSPVWLACLTDASQSCALDRASPANELDVSGPSAYPCQALPVYCMRAPCCRSVLHVDSEEGWERGSIQTAPLHRRREPARSIRADVPLPDATPFGTS